MPRSTLAVLIASLAVTAAHAAPAPASPKEIVATAVRIADEKTTRLRMRARLPDASLADIRVLLSWGSGVDHEMSIAAFREGVGRWRIERVNNGGDMAGDYRRAMLTATISYLTPDESAELDTLLRDPSLYNEPAYAEGKLSIGATVSIRVEDRKHDAELLGDCPGLTGRIVSILDGKNSHLPPTPDGAH